MDKYRLWICVGLVYRSCQLQCTFVAQWQDWTDGSCLQLFAFVQKLCHPRLLQDLAIFTWSFWRLLGELQIRKCDSLQLWAPDTLCRTWRIDRPLCSSLLLAKPQERVQQSAKGDTHTLPIQSGWSGRCSPGHRFIFCGQLPVIRPAEILSRAPLSV